VSIPKVIAIDGPVAAGKSTVARLVARRLGWRYVDTGAMYRAVGWKASQVGLPPDRADEIVTLCGRMQIQFEGDDPTAQRVIVDGVDVTAAIRSAAAGEMASAVSAIPGVRERLVAVQRAIGDREPVVMEGRDIQTAVFPEAPIKVFLTASPRERARRRWQELRDRGEDTDLDQLTRDIERRDLRDSTREHSPLRPAPGAITIDTEGLTPEQVADRIVEIAQATEAAHPPNIDTASGDC
jgi:cytidylate kinase